MARSWLLVLVLGAACAPVPAGRTTLAPRPVQLSREPVCHACFWEHQPPEQRAELLAVLSARTPEDPLVRADLRLIVARTAGDAHAACMARSEFARLADAERDGDRRLLAAETVAFMAEECGDAPGPAFRKAAGAARAAGQRWKASVYADLADGSFRPLWTLPDARRGLTVPPGATGYVLGTSAIRVRAGDTVVTQVERVARDWLSYRHDYDFRPALATESVLDYHEGARTRELVAAGVRVLRPASGTLAIRVADRWYAADAAGVFRFEVLPDKVQYPSTRAWQGVALLVDTHGIASLAEPAIRLGADLVIGCGDDAGKVAAAIALAGQGVNVYMPTDDFAADLLGYQADAVVVGSAPVRPDGAGGAIIGDRPVAFRFDERVVVERAPTLAGGTRYYNAPAKYFARLAELLPIQVDYVDVDDAGQSERVVDRAREAGARVIGVRVWTEGDYQPVRAWLAASAAHRAVLLHSAVYPAGRRLFAEFPGQTTFADGRPVFTTGSY